MIPVDESAGAWRVISKRRDGRRGWCMPTFIHNVQYHYTNLVAFEDGVVDCWEGLDLPLFAKKLATGWIATTVPPGGHVGVFNLGGGIVDSFEPLLKLADVEHRVLDAIRSWNPELRDLVDLEGNATEPLGKIRRAKLPALDGVPFRIDAQGSLVRGREVPVIEHRGDIPKLTRWFVYADGTSRVGSDGPLIPFEAATALVAEGKVGTKVHDKEWIAIDGVGRVRFLRGGWHVDGEERVREQRDHLAALQGTPDAIARCMQQWTRYEADPSDIERERLRETYEAVPKHLRMYCGDMDSKDTAIRRALGIRSRD